MTYNDLHTYNGLHRGQHRSRGSMPRCCWPSERVRHLFDEEGLDPDEVEALIRAEGLEEEMRVRLDRDVQSA